MISRAVIFRGLWSVAVVCCGSAAAACDQNIASCTFNAGAKTLNVCLSGNTATYAFGSANGAPELALKAPLASLDYTPWPGVGRTIFETVTFYNADYSYEVFAGAERVPDADPPFGGILVRQGDTEVAALDCDAGSMLWDGATTITKAKRAIGQCWDYADFRWRSCG